MIQLKNNSSDFNLLQNINGKFVPEKFQDLHLSVKLEKFLDIALEIKEAEVQMIVPSACKKVDKLVSFMKREIEERIKNSKEKLREEIKQYRKVQKARVREYAMSGAIIQTQDYIIDENKLFPDISSFQCYVESLHPTGLAGFFMPQPKRSCTIEDMTFHSEEFSKNCCAHIPFFQKYVSSIVSIPNYVLKLLELEINSLMKVVFEMNCDKAKAVLHGLSFISVENISQDASASRMNKGILFNIVSILNDTTSILMFGQPNYQNCEVALKLDEDCGLVYFERAENIKKWKPLFDDVNEIAIDVGLNEFGKTGCLDKIATQFDRGVTTVPMGPSICERLIGDIGILQQIKFVFLELHHSNYFCRNCNANFSLSFDHVLKILNCSLKNLANSAELLPLISGTLSANDLTIAKYVSRIILQRGALLTAICLSSVLERIQKEKISIITTSFFIRESELYRRMLKIFVSYLNPGKKVDFVHSDQSDCGIGASMMAAYKSHINRETPGLYLLEIEQHLKNKNKFFSIQSFLKLLSDPELALEAEMLAKRFMIEMKFDLPLAVIWAHHFINGKIEEAENLCKEYCISLAKVSHLVCQKISFTKNLDLAKTYIEFLKSYGAEQSVKIDAYKVLFDLLFYNEMYQEAVSLVQECKDRKIPLSKLRHSTLAVLHDFCLRESHTSGQVPTFSVSIEDFDTSNLDSDSEGEIDNI